MRRSEENGEPTGVENVVHQYLIFINSSKYFSREKKGAIRKRKEVSERRCSIIGLKESEDGERESNYFNQWAVDWKEFFG